MESLHHPEPLEHLGFVKVVHLERFFQPIPVVLAVFLGPLVGKLEADPGRGANFVVGGLRHLGPFDRVLDHEAGRRKNGLFGPIFVNYGS